MVGSWFDAASDLLSFTQKESDIRNAATSFRETLAPAPDERKKLVMEVFGACDVDRDGNLNEQETLHFAQYYGYKGTLAEWTKEFDRLCDHLDASGSIDFERFHRLVDDESERGCYCTNAKLERLLYRLRTQEAVQIKADSAEQIEADILVNKGFTVKQLLSFYAAYAEKGKIKKNATTRDVLRDIILPETLDDARRYMDSSFMQGLGGGQRAKTFVSHATNSRFVNTVLNILSDAAGCIDEDLIVSSEQDADMMPLGCYSRHTGMLDAAKMLENLKNIALKKTYWLCTFAVSQHKAASEDAWTCSILAAKKMDALLVSLDPDLTPMTRVWAIAEIGEYCQFIPIRFGAVLGLSADVVQKLKTGDQLPEKVEDCEAYSKDDKKRILDELRITRGGFAGYNAFVSSVVEISFGRCYRLLELSAEYKRAIASLKELHMNFVWNKTMASVKKEVLGQTDCFKVLKHLRRLDMDFRHLSNLSNLSGMGTSLATLKHLTSLSMDFTDCTSIATVDFLSEIQELPHLRTLSLNFHGCTELKYISAFNPCLQEMRGLHRLYLNFKYTRIRDVAVLGYGVKTLSELRHASFDFEQTYITDVLDFGAVIEELRTLKSFELSLRGAKTPVAFQKKFEDQASFLDVFRYWRDLNEIVGFGFQEIAARSALDAADTVEGAVDLLQKDVETIMDAGFTREQAQEALEGWDAEGKAAERAVNFLKDVLAIVKEGFSVDQAWKALLKWKVHTEKRPKVTPIRRSNMQGGSYSPESDKVGHSSSKLSHLASTRTAGDQKSTLERAKKWLKVSALVSNGFTEVQAFYALEQKGSLDEALKLLTDIADIVALGFTEEEARDAMASRGSKESALKFLQGCSQRTMRCLTCRCRRKPAKKSQSLQAEPGSPRTSPVDGQVAELWGQLNEAPRRGSARRSQGWQRSPGRSPDSQSPDRSRMNAERDAPKDSIPEHPVYTMDKVTLETV